MGKLELLCVADGNGAATLENNLIVLQKVKHRITNDMAVLLFGLYQKKKKKSKPKNKKPGIRYFEKIHVHIYL